MIRWRDFLCGFCLASSIYSFLFLAFEWNAMRPLPKLDLSIGAGCSMMGFISLFVAQLFRFRRTREDL
jgi:hypothetical protein